MVLGCPRQAAGDSPAPEMSSVPFERRPRLSNSIEGMLEEIRWLDR